MQTSQQIQEICAQSPTTTLQMRGDLDVLVVENPLGKAEILVQGAQLIGFTPAGQKPIIWKSAQTFYEKGTPIRGGIPLIGPWFSGFAHNPDEVKKHVKRTKGVPAHGFIRSAFWQLEEIDETGAGETIITLRFTFEGNDDLWDASFDVRVTYSIGTELSVDLNFDNTSSETMTYSSALHTYFAISHIDGVSVPSFDGRQYIDTLDEWKEKTYSGAMDIDRELDYIFSGEHEQQLIVDHVWNRSIILAPRGSNSTIVWNPWISKSKDLSMFDDDEYQGMLCIETANAAHDAVTLAPGENHTLGVTLSSKTL